MFVIARTAKGRPTLMHQLGTNTYARTACGQDVSAWSRSYHDSVIEAVFCKKCKAIGGR